MTREESLQTSPEEGIKLLNTQITKGQALLSSRPISSDNHGSWELVTRNYLEKVFGSNSPNVSSVTDVGKWGISVTGEAQREKEEECAEEAKARLTATARKVIRHLVGLGVLHRVLHRSA